MTRSQFYFLFSDPAAAENYTLSLHDALPIYCPFANTPVPIPSETVTTTKSRTCSPCPNQTSRSEEHTSELQSPAHLVCRALLEKKKAWRYGRSRGPSCTSRAPRPMRRAERRI